MRIVPIVASPNQAFTVTLDNVRWGVALKEARGVMCADVSRDGVRVLSGTRVLAGEPIIPYRYLQTANFLMLTPGDDLPDWRVFGNSQSLVYLAADEIAALQAPTAAEMEPFVPSYLTDDDGFYLTTDTGDLLTDD